MRYLRIENLTSDMQVARPLVGDDGRLLVNAGRMITPTILKRLVDMGFQGAYIETPGFEDVIIQDAIPDELRTRAFLALYEENYEACVSIARQMVEEMRTSPTMSLDLMDIKNNKNYEYRHCVSVAVYSVALGLGCGLNQEQLNNLAVAALLHDIGKFDIKRRVLNAKHIYNEKEMDEMKKHPMFSYEVVKDMPAVSSVSRNTILFHHENLDGTGYYGITGEKLGIFPRILRVADTYDALTARRQYRQAYTPSYAIEYLMSNVDTLFDKNVIDVFVRNFPVYPKGFTVKLTNGEIAVVVSNEENSQRPVLRTLEGRTIHLATEPSYRTVMIKEMI